MEANSQMRWIAKNDPKVRSVEINLCTTWQSYNNISRQRTLGYNEHILKSKWLIKYTNSPCYNEPRL